MIINKYIHHIGIHCIGPSNGKQLRKNTYVRLRNFRLVNMKISRDDLWTTVKTVKREYIENIFKSLSTCSKGLISNNDIITLVATIGEQIGMEEDYNIYANISEETLSAAGQMFVYLIICPPKTELDSIAEELSNSIKVYSSRELLIILNRLLHAPGHFRAFIFIRA